MYLKYQIVYSKTEPGELGRKVAKREIMEKTNLYIEDDQLHYLANNPAFNCDIYFAKLNRFEIPKKTESHNMGSWLYYSWIT